MQVVASLWMFRRTRAGILINFDAEFRLVVGCVVPVVYEQPMVDSASSSGCRYLTTASPYLLLFIHHR